MFNLNSYLKWFTLQWTLCVWHIPFDSGLDTKGMMYNDNHHTFGTPAHRVDVATGGEHQAWMPARRGRNLQREAQHTNRIMH